MENSSDPALPGEKQRIPMLDINKLLNEVKNGEKTPEEAALFLRQSRYEEMGYAKLDTDRTGRQGFPETVFCQGKTPEQLRGIFPALFSANGMVLGTRADEKAFEEVKKVLPQAEYDPVSRILSAGGKEPRTGKVVVCTAGTADIPVAEEAARTAEFFGCNTVRLFDVGVSGLHRLLKNLGDFEGASCVIAVAGMEGALASVIGGLVDCPVIAVPTSVGYGAAFEGLSALLTMINSCANCVSVLSASKARTPVPRT